MTFTEIAIECAAAVFLMGGWAGAELALAWERRRVSRAARAAANEAACARMRAEYLGRPGLLKEDDR